MKSSKRAERRHHNDRLIRNRFKRELRWVYAFTKDDEEEMEIRRIRARKMLDTNVNCSCAMCGNPRRNYGWASWGVLTFQEIKADYNLRDGLEEYFEEGVDNEAANQ